LHGHAGFGVSNPLIAMDLRGRAGEPGLRSAVWNFGAAARTAPGNPIESITYDYLGSRTGEMT